MAENPPSEPAGQRNPPRAQQSRNTPKDERAKSSAEKSKLDSSPSRPPEHPTDAAGPDRTAATDFGETRTDSAKERQEWLEEADRVFIQGDVVNGDKHVFVLGHGEHRIRMRHVSPEVEEPAHDAFAEPKNWEHLRDSFMRRHVALLVAAPGSGRTATGIRLLIEGEHSPIYTLDTDTDLLSFADSLESDGSLEERRPRGAGFLISNPTLPASLSGDNLQRIDHLLEQTRARLVIITDADVSLPDHDALDYQLPTPDPPPLRVIFESHLRWRLKHRLEHVLQQDDISDMVDEFLTDDQPAKRAAHLATLIWWKATDGKVDVAAVRSLMDQRDADDFTIWLDGLTDRGDSGFAIALAVLDGLPYENINDEAKKLNNSLSDKRDVQGGYWKHLRNFRAGPSLSYARSDAFGRTVVKSVEYWNSSYPRRILERSWRDAKASEMIFSWLLDLAADSDNPRIRIRAAAALGALSVGNFDYFYSRFFDPWAKDDSERRREAVANALRIPAAESKTTSNVMRVIENWHGAITPNDRVRATAARTYGVTLPDAGIDWLIDRLGRLGVMAEFDVERAVGRSLSDLIARGEGRFVDSVLRALCEWLHNPRRSRAAVHGFLIAAASLVVESDSEVDGATPPLWPFLLLLADQNYGIRGNLCDLWSFVLQDWGLSNFPCSILTQWAMMAEHDSGARRTFAYLLGGVTQTNDRSRSIVLRLVDQWASPDNLQPLDATAAYIREYLTLLDMTADSLESPR